MELQITAVKNGTVIDHIPSDKTMKIVELLGLTSSNERITVAFNIDSSRSGKKGIIKIADRKLSSAEIEKIALIAEKSTINIIENFKVVDKKYPTLPEVLHNIIKCQNNKCITNIEDIESKFELEDENSLRCFYCERTMDKKEAVIK
jgi:aspartate carbamoyltransferase regulatory subunit